jgi:hypothetical protein
MVFKWSDHADPTIRILLLLVVVPWGCDFKGCDLKGCDAAHHEKPYSA